MRKINKSSKFLAVTLTASIAAFGCTTNWNRSNGEPAMGTTSATAPTTTPGSSGGTIPQPMTSSSSIGTNSEIPKRSAADALAIMQSSAPTTQGRYLGPSFPPNTGSARVGGYVDPTASDPAMLHRRLTINSSIANPAGPQAAVVSGAGGFDDAEAIFADELSVPTVNVGATTGAATTIAGAAPTASSIPVTSGAFSGATGTLTPSTSSGAVPTATVATSPVVLGSQGMLSSSSVIVGTGANASVSSGAVSTGAAGVRLNGAATTTHGSRITVTRSSTGRVVISNVK